MKRISLLLATSIFILSCGTSKKLVYKDLSVDEIKKNEWVSFNVNTKYYIGKKLFGEYPTSTIVIHKLNDSTMQLAVLERAKTINTSTLLTNEKVILIDSLLTTHGSWLIAQGGWGYRLLKYRCNT